MRTLIVTGSHRKNSESARIAAYVAKRLQSLGLDAQPDIVDLAAQPLPEWGGPVEAPVGSDWMAPWKELLMKAEQADSFVLVSPEWNGMVPPRLKNFLLVCSTAGKPLAHKAGYIVSVSAAINGAYPVIELRTSGYKNTDICYSPEHLIVRHVAKNFREGDPVDQEDSYLRDRMDYGLKVLAQYAQALTQVRESGVIDHKAYPNGM